jgi:hypothetical protein
MNLRRIPFLSLTAALALSGYASPLHAGEKIQFSGSGHKDKSNELATPRTRPLMQTLDFKQLTGHGATISPEQLAPVPPPQEGPIDTKEMREKAKKDREWLKTEDKDDGKDSTDKDDRNSNRKQDKNSKGKDNERERRESKLRDPFDTSTKSKNDLDYDSSSGSSTNRISFSSRDKRPENPFEIRPNSGNGSFENNSPGGFTGRPRGAQANPFDNNEHAETQKMLGITPLGSQNMNQPATLNLLNGSQANSSARPLDITGNNSSTFGGNNGNQFNGRSTVFKTGLGDAGLGGFEAGGPNQRAPVNEPFKMERKPAVLPMPQRKF